MYLAVRAIKHSGYRHRWSERFGMTELRPTQLLIHTASMGETLAAVPLIRTILARNPNFTVTITSSSPTGSSEVLKAFGDKVQHCYLPVDLPICIKRFIKQVRPAYCIILETELWPNLLHYAHRQGTKVMLANARLSSKSAEKYHKWQNLVNPMLNCLTLVAVQTETEASRFIALGLDKIKISTCGSLKFDVTISDQLITKGQEIRQSWGKDHAPVWVAGSVHPGEFEAVIDAHLELIKVVPDALLIMVPRHPEKFDAAAQLLASKKVKFVRRSNGQTVTGTTQVLLGDTMGELLQFYAVGDQAYVGGSLIEHGGQNPIEAAAIGLKLLMGPSQYNFTDICGLLRDAHALDVVNDSNELAQVLINDVSHPQALEVQQQSAMVVVQNNQGAVSRQYAVFEALMKS